MTAERRAYPRLKGQVPIEIFQEASGSPIRAQTADISLSGCYVSLLFPLEIGTSIEARLRLGDVPIIVVGEIKTRDPQVGNGIHFLRMLPEDRHELEVFIGEKLESSGSDVTMPSPQITEKVHV